MKNLGRVHSLERPQEIQITNTNVFIASNIQPYEETLDNHYIQGFEYDYIEYSKDEYLMLLAQQNATLIDELQATKILLGVE